MLNVATHTGVFHSAMLSACSALYSCDQVDHRHSVLASVSYSQIRRDRVKERSGCRSLLPALTRSPVSAACPMQTCFTSIADATENCKERSCFSFLTRASMKLIFILGTSGTRWPAFLSIKVWHYAANLAVSLSKGLLFPPDLSLTLFWHVNMSSWLSA